jgi:MraZ protein
MFTGEYRHSVDEKGRIAVPAKFRAQLAHGGYASRWLDGCLAIHTPTGWDDLGVKVAALRTVDPEARLFERRIFSGAFELELDRQGRIVIPAYLRDEIGLTTDAVIVGSRDHAEIWAPDRWTEYQAKLADPDDFAKAIAGLGI